MTASQVPEGSPGPSPERPSERPWVKAVTDYLPLAAFFGAYLLYGLMVATAVLIGVSLVAVAIAWILERRVPMMTLVTVLVVVVFGGLTLWLADERFIKMKPTIVLGAMGLVLLGGLAFGKALLRPVMGAAWPMTDDGWWHLTLRFGLFFLAMAGLNELAWRLLSTDAWVTFKVFGILGLNLLFVMSQLPLMNRHHLPETADEGEGG